MNKSLKTLTRIKKFDIDEQRKLLVEQLNAEEQTLHELKLLTEKFESEKKFAQKNPNLCSDFGLYTKRYLKLRAALEIKLNGIRRRIEEIRDIIADMFKEQKTYEIIDTNRAKAEQKELAEKEQKLLDEVGTNSYIKHHKDQDNF